MSSIVAEISRTVEVLPQEEQLFAYELIKRLVRAWDPNFTKVTADEAHKIKLAEESGFVDEDEVNWDVVGV